MSLASINAAANDAVFQGRCWVALIAPARDIANEDPATADHVARLDWSHRVLTDRLNATPRQIALQILRNSTIAALADPTTTDDASIEYQVTQVLPDLIRIG